MKNTNSRAGNLALLYINYASLDLTVAGSSLIKWGLKQDLPAGMTVVLKWNGILWGMLSGG